MAVAASIKVVKTFPYRGSSRLWSNRYYFSDGAPADAAKWLAFSDAVTAAEKAIHNNAIEGVSIVETVGYVGGSDVPVYTKTYALAGTLATGTGVHMPGDVALMVRYATATRTIKNHPLYLYNWYHGVMANSATNGDIPLVAARTAISTYAANWITGFSDGVVQHHRCGPNGDLATGSLVDTVLRHRDFPRA